MRRALVAGLALVVALLVQRTVAGADAARAAWGASRPVAVATRDLPPGHDIEPGDVRVERRPIAALPPGAVGAVDPGRVVRSLVLEGEVVVRRRLVAAGTDGVAGLLPADTRAVAIPIEASTAPPLRVGQMVDLIGVGTTDGDGIGTAVLAASAPVVHVAEHAVTVALEPGSVALVAAALASGAITIAVVS